MQLSKDFLTQYEEIQNLVYRRATDLYHQLLKMNCEHYSQDFKKSCDSVICTEIDLHKEVWVITFTHENLGADDVTLFTRHLEMSDDEWTYWLVNESVWSEKQLEITRKLNQKTL